MTASPAPYRVHMAQISPALGDLSRNRDLHLERIEAAIADGASLIVFPELSLTGYLLQDLAPDVGIDPARAPLLAPMREVSRRIDIVLGLVEAGDDGRFYNTAIWLSDGAVRHRHRKIHLPTYTLFDEGRDFAPGDAARAFDTSFGRTAMLICEDLWHPALTYVLALDGADLLIVLSNGPGRGVSGERLGSQRAWMLLGETAARFQTLFVVYVNRAGGEDGLTFGGGSFAFGPDGVLLGELPALEEAGLSVTLDRRDLSRARSLNPLRRDARPELIHAELERILAARADLGTPARHSGGAQRATRRGAKK